MPLTSRIFRIFVSSTFSDLKVERDALQEYVFPRLSELCRRHGATFQAIDLRWGVSEEAALDQQTIRICLEEIARCQRVTPRPNFVILLGDRYGWKPLAYAIPGNEMERVLPLLTEEERRLAIWEEGRTDAGNQPVMACWNNGQPSGEKGWYRLDTNAVQPVYLLQPRPSGSRFQQYSTWAEQVERPLHAALERAAAALELTEQQRLKYHASATHQEIVAGALRVEDAGEHVFAFFRTVDSQAELIAGLAADSTRPAGVPRASDFLDLNLDGTADVQGAAEQSELRDLLARRLPGNIHTYHARWAREGLTTEHIGTLPQTLDDCLTLNEILDEPTTLCEAVWRRLSRVILDQLAKLEALDPLMREQQAHREFGQERIRLFVGRQDLLSRIARYLDGDDHYPLVISGSSGAGKSALMAKVAEQARAQHPEALIVLRFIGATAGSTDGRTFLESLSRQIVREYGGDEGGIAPEYSALAFSFRDRLALATCQRPLIVLVDALDQLSGSDEAKRLAWLPTKMPEYVHLIVSTRTGSIPDSVRARLARAAGEVPFLAVEPLSAGDGAAILDGWLREPQQDPLLGPVSRTLTREQWDHVLAKFVRAGGVPIYLRVAYEQVRHWCAYDGLPRLADRMPGLAEDVGGIIGDLFWGLEQPESHGHTLVAHALGYLVAARHGLSDDELLEVLSADADVMADFLLRSPGSPPSSHLPPVVWSRLYHDLEPYFVERQAPGGLALLGFYHGEVAKAAVGRYLEGEDEFARHRGLADYFMQQPTWQDEQHGKANARKAAELADQLRRGARWSELTATLTDFDFLEAVVRCLSVFDLETSYRDALAAWGGEEADRSMIAAFEERLRLESHHFHTQPELLFPQLYNHLSWLDGPGGPIHVACERARRGRAGWLRMIQDPRPAPPQWTKALSGHTAGVQAVRVTSDGYIVSASGKESYPHSEDNTIRVWDLDSGLFLHSLNGHTNRVNALALTADGRIVSGSFDATIKIWDLNKGLLRTLQSPSGWVDDLAISDDGRIVSGSEGTIEIWDLESGRLLQSLEEPKEPKEPAWYYGATKSAGHRVLVMSDEYIVTARGRIIRVRELESGRLLHSLVGHTDRVTGLAETINGHVVSVSHDKTIKIWDPESGQLLRSLQDTRVASELESVVLTPGGLIVAGSWGVIWVWDLESGRLLHSLHGHTGKVTSLALAGDRLVSGSLDQSVKVWEMRSGQMLHSLEGHKECVRAVTVTADGCVVSGSWDKTIRVWDLERSRLLSTLKGHKYHVLSLALTTGGCIVSGSADNTIRVWNVEGGPSVRCLEGHTGGVRCVAVTVNGRIVSGSEDKTIRVWDLESGLLLRVLKGHKDVVRAVTVTGDGRIVSGSLDMTIKVWDIESGRLLRSLCGNRNSVHAIALTADDRIVSGSWGTIEVWDLNTGRHLRSLEVRAGPVYSLALSADGCAVLGSDDGTIQVWDLESGQLLHSMNDTGAVYAVALTENGRIVSGSLDHTVKVWDCAAIKPQRSLEGHTGAVDALVATKDGRVVSGSRDKHVKVWEASSGQLLSVLDWRMSAVTGVALATDGRIVTSSMEGSINIWDAESRHLLGSLGSRIENADFRSTIEGRMLLFFLPAVKPVVEALPQLRLISRPIFRWLTRYSDRISALAVTPDGRIVSCSGDRTIEIWDLESGRLLRSLKGHADTVTALMVTDDGRIVSGSSDGTIDIWNLNSGRLLRTLKGHMNIVHALALTSAGRIISVSWDAIKVWDLERGLLLHSFEPDQGRGPGPLAVTKDGCIVSGSGGTIELWNLELGQFQSLFACDYPVTSLALSSDGHWLGAGDSDGKVWLFEYIRAENSNTMDRAWRAANPSPPPSSAQPQDEPKSKLMDRASLAIYAFFVVGDWLAIPAMLGGRQHSWSAFALSLVLATVLLLMHHFVLFRGDRHPWQTIGRGLALGYGIAWAWLGWALGLVLAMRWAPPFLSLLFGVFALAWHLELVRLAKEIVDKA